MAEYLENEIKEDEVLPIGLKGLETDAEDVEYDSGKSVEELEPAEANANESTGALADKDAADFATEVTGAEKPDNNADVTSANTANDTSNVNSVTASRVQTRAETFFKKGLFLGNSNDGLTEVVTGAGVITRLVMSTILDGGAVAGNAILKSSEVRNSWSELEFFARVGLASHQMNSDARVFFGLVGSVVPNTWLDGAADPGLGTEKHLGFYMKEGRNLFATVGDGAGNETEVSISGGLILSFLLNFRTVFDSGTNANAKFYRNDFLVVTISTNLPSGNSETPILFFNANNNGAAAALSISIRNNYQVLDGI